MGNIVWFFVYVFHFICTAQEPYSASAISVYFKRVHHLFFCEMRNVTWHRKKQMGNVISVRLWCNVHRQWKMLFGTFMAWFEFSSEFSRTALSFCFFFWWGCELCVGLHCLYETSLSSSIRILNNKNIIDHRAQTWTLSNELLDNTSYEMLSHNIKQESVSFTKLSMCHLKCQAWLMQISFFNLFKCDFTLDLRLFKRIAFVRFASSSVENAVTQAYIIPISTRAKDRESSTMLGLSGCWSKLTV